MYCKASVRMLRTKSTGAHLCLHPQAAGAIGVPPSSVATAKFHTLNPKQDMPKPRARSNAMLAVAGDTLWLFGGIVEVHPKP